MCLPLKPLILLFIPFLLLPHSPSLSTTFLSSFKPHPLFHLSLSTPLPSSFYPISPPYCNQPPFLLPPTSPPYPLPTSPLYLNPLPFLHLSPYPPSNPSPLTPFPSFFYPPPIPYSIPFPSFIHPLLSPQSNISLYMTNKKCPS